ncbi:MULTISPECIES: glycosyltransferase family 25 protein [unclassified Mesorhizobium]|uniref:glycosyltransferase family 25 protein n=1 Tax=unclassified Mesorhizobium TaxID=325217 RepID=UPI00112A09B5|nr:MULTISPECIES: glycosyltransferase family 25 protein [unclassified Mesorhizobium]MBZ9739701.1 glycosyltransferase family 25 protein [Mesorhizobium sp. CO1-1-4]MBZ9805035.1 glycosyltransferase family 25 protein [Mesorhizobium sp. ES1-6]TPL83529.1 glycosyltransferase family 25 protein [Mesorhizobium sp. B2-3-12]
MRCLVINLDRSPARFSQVTAEFGRIGITFERVPAVDGLVQQFIEDISPDLSLVEIGCVLSHRACWQLVADGDDPYVGVFEDDIVFSETAGRLLAHENWIPADADIIKLETFFSKTVVSLRRAAPIMPGHELHRLHWLHCGSAGYIVSRQAAIDLLEATKSNNRAVDIVLFDTTSPPSSNRTIYQLSPALCAQARHFPDKAAEFPSEMEANRSAKHSERAKRKRKGPWTKIAVEVRRVWRQVFDLFRLRRGANIAFVYRGKRFRRPARQASLQAPQWP